MKIKRVAIIGGGTAGWLAANHLGAELRQSDIEIHLRRGRRYLLQQRFCSLAIMAAQSAT